MRIKDGEILELAPPTAAVLINHPFDRITTPFSEGEVSLAYACNEMNIFRSEEHAQGLEPLRPGPRAVLPVEAIVAMSAHPLFADRRRSDYYPRQEALFRDLMASMQG